MTNSFFVFESSLPSISKKTTMFNLVVQHFIAICLLTVLVFIDISIEDFGYRLVERIARLEWKQAFGNRSLLAPSSTV